MSALAKLRIGDIVYHRDLDLGPGKVRYLFRGAVTVSFEKTAVQRYSKQEICKVPFQPGKPTSDLADAIDKGPKPVPAAA